MPRSWRHLLASATGIAVLGTSLVVVAAPVDTAAAATKVAPRLRAAVKNLPVASETRAGYARAKFRHWVDANSDCQNTRAEVLKRESRVRVRGCTIRRGRWFSYYDRRTWRRASDVDVDHLVALAEAWDSGAKRWNADTRKRFANDLRDGRALVAVTDNVNQSKGARDPADWLPRFGKCRYVKEWTAVKIRWRLKVNPAEKRRLVRVASGCRNVRVHVTKAAIGLASGGGGKDPRFSYCYQAKAAGYGPYRRGRDPEYWWYTDADSDGVVCE